MYDPALTRLQEIEQELDSDSIIFSQSFEKTSGAERYKALLSELPMFRHFRSASLRTATIKAPSS